MMISLNRITQRITSVIALGEVTITNSAILLSELNMFTAGFKACQDAVIFETNHVLDPETEIEIPKQWEKYFEKEQEEYQEYLRLKTKFEK